MDYNVIVIGAGSGGLVSAYICAVLKAKVLLIEKHKMGGDCLNTGCVPSKALIRTTTILADLKRHRDFGLKKVNVEFDFRDVMERVQRVIGKIEPHDSADRYSKLGVECIQGAAKILSPNQVGVGDKIYTTKNIIVATGGRPSAPKIPGLDQIRYLHTDNIWEIREQPKRMIVLGAGPIGCELGQCFTRLGTKVTMVVRGRQILKKEDADVAKVVEERLTGEGMEILFGTTPVEVKTRGDQKVLVVKRGDKEEELEFDQILVAVGRAPNVKGFGLEELGVELNPQNTLKTDAYSRTSVKNIFACGDVTSPYQFTHMAAHQAWYCAVNALFQPLKKFKVDLTTIPWCTYTDPEIARVGFNEQEAKAAGVPYEVSVYPLDDLDRAITDEQDHGMVKVLTKPGTDKILGVTICGYHAGDLLAEFVFARKYGLGLNSILNTIHAYPTMAEANKFAAGVWKKAHKPEAILNLVAKFHSWRRR